MVHVQNHNSIQYRWKVRLQVLPPDIISLLPLQEHEMPCDEVLQALFRHLQLKYSAHSLLIRLFLNPQLLHLPLRRKLLSQAPR